MSADLPELVADDLDPLQPSTVTSLADPSEMTTIVIGSHSTVDVHRPLQFKRASIAMCQGKSRQHQSSHRTLFPTP